MILLLLLLQETAHDVSFATADGSSLKGTTTVQSIKVTTDVGELEISVEKIRTVTFGSGKVTIFTHEGSGVNGTCSVAEWKFATDLGPITVKSERMRQISFPAHAKAPEVKPKPTPGPQPGPGPKPGPSATVDNDVAPVTTFKLSASVEDLFLSNDRKWLYLLNTTTLKLHRIDTAKLAVDSTAIDVPKGTEAMCLSPDGATIYVAASPDGHLPIDRKQTTGKIVVVDAASWKIRTTFAVDVDPWDIEADDARVYVTCGYSATGAVVVIDVAKSAVVAQWGRREPFAVLRITPDRRRLYFGQTEVQPADFWCAPIPDDPAKTKVEVYDSPYHGEHPLGGRFEISPDGAFLAAATGSVLRLTKVQDGDLKHAGRVESHTAAAFDKGTLLTATASGMFRRYALPDVTLVRSARFGGKAYRLAYDPATKMAFCAVETEKPKDPRAPHGTGDLAVYSLTELMKEK